MERIKILKDFVNFCTDCKLDKKEKKSKTKYTNAYIKNHITYNGIENIETIRKEIEDTLKYNPLTIEKIKKERLKGEKKWNVKQKLTVN